MQEKIIKPQHEFRDQLLQLMIDNEGIDMYITVGAYPSIKIAGEMVAINDGIEKLKWKDTFEFAQSLITEKQHDKLTKTRNLDFSFSFGNRRFRGNISFQLSNYMIILRLLTSDIPSIDDLNLTDIYKDITKKGQGLVLVTGPTGSGKTTTLAAIINHINDNYKKHIITIEDPIEYIHENKNSIIEHKEVGKDVLDYETALLGAMRQTPDVIMFGEMRTKAEMAMALRLAETGHLVFSTLHTRSAYQTITRIIDAFSAEEKNQIRIQLADSLVGVFSQRLLSSVDGTSRILAKEVLLKNSAVSNLIRENELHQIPSVLQTSSRDGMILLESELIKLIDRGEITKDEGLKYANNPKLIKQSIL